MDDYCAEHDAALDPGDYCRGCEQELPSSPDLAGLLTEIRDVLRGIKQDTAETRRRVTRIHGRVRW